MLCFNIKPHFSHLRNVGICLDPMPNHQTKFCSWGYICCVSVHPDLCCSMFRLCMTFYMLAVSVAATSVLFCFGATPEASRRNMSLILPTEESFINWFQGSYHSGVKPLINQADKLKCKCWSKKKKYCKAWHLHFISAKILPFLNNKRWLQHWSKYQQRWESWTPEQLWIIKRNCSVLPWKCKAEVLIARAFLELCWSWAAVGVTFLTQLISSCGYTVCRSFTFIPSSPEINAVRLQNMLPSDPFVVSDFSLPLLLVYVWILCWGKKPARYHLICTDNWQMKCWINSYTDERVSGSWRCTYLQVWGTGTLRQGILYTFTKSLQTCLAVMGILEIPSTAEGKYCNDLKELLSHRPLDNIKSWLQSSRC